MEVGRVLLSQLIFQKAIILENKLFESNIKFESVDLSIDGVEVKEIYVSTNNLTKSIDIKENFLIEERKNNLRSSYFVRLLSVGVLLLILIYGLFSLYESINLLITF